VPDFDAIVIGTGQAGPFLAARLAKAGMKVAAAERHRFGGTCVNTGCIPTKAMVASARAAHVARRAAEFGVSAGPVTVDMARVKARKDAISGESRTGIERLVSGAATVYRGHARLESEREVSVAGERLRAPRIFLNVGARATVPPLPGLGAYLTNSSILELDCVPPHLLIVGGGYIGLEFGQMFRRFGSRVTIVHRGPRLVEREDEDASAALLEILEREGIEVRLNQECIAVSEGPELRLGSGETVRGSHLLLAVGRTPNTGDLGLENAGVRRDQRGYIEVDDQLSTSVPGIWALGDCNGRGGFTHTSYNDYEIVAANLLEGESRRVSDRIPAYALYTDPPLGRAGMTEAEARRAGKRVLVASRPMTRVGRAVEKGETQGFMKFVVDAETRHLLGAAILGTGGDEIVHSVLDAMYSKAPYTTIQRAMHIHPTVSELIPTTLGEIQA